MILITGANGVVGRQVMNPLLREGTAVAAVTRGLGKTELPGNAKVVSGDLFRPQWLRHGMLAQGLPEDVPARLLGSLADYSDRPGPTTNTVQDLLGRPALTFADWAHGNASAFSS
jgi:NAD(P)-dependent dehydrogenase (short-subunit alcohol dehydrogenase family)